MYRISIMVLSMLVMTSLIGTFYDMSVADAATTGIPISRFTYLFYGSAWSLGMVVIAWLFRNYQAN